MTDEPKADEPKADDSEPDDEQIEDLEAPASSLDDVAGGGICGARSCYSGTC